jgi:hypothetical protein
VLGADDVRMIDGIGVAEAGMAALEEIATAGGGDEPVLVDMAALHLVPGQQRAEIVVFQDAAEIRLRC